MEKIGIFYFVAFLVLKCVEGESENVALNKRVVGAGKWRESAVDGKFQTTFAPDAVEFPYYFVDLGAVYNLSSINLFAQNQWSFYEQGINVNFDVHTYGEWMSPCGFESKYPWDPLAYNQSFKKKGQEIVFHPDKPVQYIIIGTPNHVYPSNVQPIVIGEIQAHGEKIRETVEPQIPEETPAPPNFYLETRKKILGKQEKVWINPDGGYFVPNNKMKDVVVAWTSDPVIMAVTRKQARVVVLTADALTKEINTLPLYKELKANMKNWLSPNVTDAAYVPIASGNYNQSDVLLINRKDTFDVNAIYEKLTSGQNSAIIGFPPEETNDDSAAQLLNKLEIEYVKRNITSTGNKFVDTRNVASSSNYIPPAYILERFRKYWSAFLGEKFDLPISQYQWDDEETKLELKKFVEHYERFFERYAPCAQAPYRKDQRTQSVLLKYNEILKHQHGEKCFPLTNVHIDPGVVRFQKPTTVTVNIYADKWGNFFPTGVYANPGDGFVYTILEDSDWTLRGQFLRVNLQTDVISNHNEWQRWPSVSTQIPLRRTGKLCSPHGGPILLRLPEGANITMKLENVYRYPWLDMRNPETLKTFAEELKKYAGVPWLMLAGDSMDTMLKTADAYTGTASEVIQSVTHYDKSIKVMYNYRGTIWENVRKEAFASDRQISAGFGHSGYPIMGQMVWSHAFTLYTSSIKVAAQRGMIHELGHNFQVGEATLKWGGEVTNNVYIFVVNEFVLGLDGYAGDDVDQGKWRGTDYGGFGEGYYRYLGKMFGYGLVGNGFQAAIAAKPKSEMDKTQFWLQQMCNETGYDMLPFHSMWKVPITDATRAVCEPLPCFFPDDKWTQGAQDIVNKTLAAAGKECTRTNTKKIVFRGDITRGMNVRRPQNIFLKFED